jgi:hypothetical protein
LDLQKMKLRPSEMERVATDFMGTWDSGHVRLTDLCSAIFNSNTVKVYEVARFDMMCDRNTEPNRIARARFVGAHELHLRLEFGLVVIRVELKLSVLTSRVRVAREPQAFLTGLMVNQRIGR